MEERSLSWSRILAGAVIAIGAGWLGELLGGWMSLSGPVGSAAGTGLTSWLVLVCAGALAGGLVAGRRAPSRGAGALNGLLVWGLSAMFGALSFAILGGNVALVTGLTGAAMQAGFAYAFLALVLALPLAAIGGGIAARRARGTRRILMKTPPGEADRSRPERTEAPLVATRTHEIEVETAGGERRHEEYREGVSYPPGEKRPPLH